MAFVMHFLLIQMATMLLDNSNVEKSASVKFDAPPTRVTNASPFLPFQDDHPSLEPRAVEMDTDRDEGGGDVLPSKPASREELAMMKAELRIGGLKDIGGECEVNHVNPSLCL